jgi:hypothetical protein
MIEREQPEVPDEIKQWIDQVSAYLQYPDLKIPYRSGAIAMYYRMQEECYAWILADDRLPEDYERVLFFTRGFSTNEMRLGIFLAKDQWDRSQMFCDGAFFPVKNISHWMKAPLPPKY